MSHPGHSINAATLARLVGNLDECIELLGATERLSAPDVQLKSILSTMRREMIFYLAERIDQEEGQLLPDGSAAPFLVERAGQTQPALSQAGNS